MPDANGHSESEQLRELFAEVAATPSFTERHIDIPGDLRIAWRLSVLCLLLGQGRANSLKLEHLHVLWWAVRSHATRSLLLRWFAGEGRPDELLVRFDPSLTATLDMALGQELVVMTSTGSVKLTVTGLAYSQDVQLNEDVLAAERLFLRLLPSRISQQQFKDLLEWK